LGPDCSMPLGAGCHLVYTLHRFDKQMVP
jgi:hypothetical protein